MEEDAKLIDKPWDFGVRRQKKNHRFDSFCNFEASDSLTSEDESKIVDGEYDPSLLSKCSPQAQDRHRNP